MSEPTLHPAYRQGVSEASISQISISHVALTNALRRARRFSTSERHDLQATIVRAAKVHAVPVDFFHALIKQESAFDPNAVSSKGAQGIAQFMPATALQRGLENPFDPHAALFKSAELLKDLNSLFGNWGLAAAAYNAGPERVRQWLVGKSTLPIETRRYVQAITAGHPEWMPDGFHSSFAVGLKTKRHAPTQREWELRLLEEIRGRPQALLTASKTNDQHGALCPACITQRFY